MLVLALSAAGCGEAQTNAWLDALQRERLAHLVPDHGRLELDLETTMPHNTEDLFAKETSAVVSRVFSYGTRDAAAHARRVALDVAAAGGWRVNRYPAIPAGPLFGWKRLLPGQAKLALGHYRKGKRFYVTIRLEPAGG